MFVRRCALEFATLQYYDQCILWNAFLEYKETIVPPTLDTELDIIERADKEYFMHRQGSFMASFVILRLHLATYKDDN
jgi:hypothetical protein